MASLQAALRAHARAQERHAVATGKTLPRCIAIDMPLSRGCPYSRADAAMDELCAAFPEITFVHMTVDGLYEAWEPRAPIAVAAGEPWSALVLAFAEAVRADEAEWLQSEALKVYLGAKTREDIEYASLRGGWALDALRLDREACVRFGVDFPAAAVAMLEGRKSPSASRAALPSLPALPALPEPSAVEPAPRAPRADVPEPQPIPPRAPEPVFGPSPTLSFFCPEESPAAFRTVELSPMVCPVAGCGHDRGMHVGSGPSFGGRCMETFCRCDGYRPTSTASSHKEH